MPPSGEQTRLYVWRCPDGHIWAERPYFGVCQKHERRRGEQPTVQVERIEVLPASEVLDALENGYHPQGPSPAHPADFITVRFKLDGYENLAVRQTDLAALQSDLRIAREALERLCDFAGEMESHHGIEEVAGPTQPPTEWDQMQRDLAHEVEAARTALQQLEAGQGDG